MHLPSLSPGKRFAMPRPVGSADALLLAQLGTREKAKQQRVAIITADMQVRGGKQLPLKSIVDDALAMATTDRRHLAARRLGYRRVGVARAGCCRTSVQLRRR